ncbi:MAG: hypothetical protein K2X86_12485, partial [Cytophagaceae bacterium]|nr:hypothetical protein [Cytophagaceae bacterium]
LIFAWCLNFMQIYKILTAITYDVYYKDNRYEWGHSYQRTKLPAVVKGLRILKGFANQCAYWSGDFELSDQ